jgi:hypothetical protein
MASYKNKTVLVYDYGLFVELAVTLSKSFGRTYYYCPWQDGYPKSNALLIGEGIPGVRRVRSMWPIIDDVDLFVFPDVYEGALQSYLVSQGKRVWGCRMGEELELDRVASKEHCDAVGIDIGPYKVMKGLDALREYLEKHEDVWVKISATRGDMETFKSKNYSLIEPRLDELEHTLGAKKKVMEFIVEDAINPAVEVGYDGYVIDGKFPKGAFYGLEIKDKAYIGRTKSYDALPAEVIGVNEKLAGTFRKYGYRGFWSSEIRLTRDGRGYLIDPCTRSGSPPSELYHMIFTNLADIIWEGASGVLVEPEFSGKWGAELLLLSEWAMHNWQSIEFPKSIAEHVKMRNLTIIEGKKYYVPDRSGSSAIGAVVAVADSKQAAIDECKRIAEKVQGHYVEVLPASLDDADEEIATLKDYGIDF